MYEKLDVSQHNSFLLNCCLKVQVELVLLAFARCRPNSAGCPVTVLLAEVRVYM